MLELPKTLVLISRLKTELRPMTPQDREGFAGVEDPNALIGEIDELDVGLIIIVEEGCIGFYRMDLVGDEDTQWVQFDLGGIEPYGNVDGVY